MLRSTIGQYSSATNSSPAECTGPSSPPAACPASMACIRRSASEPGVFSNADSMAAGTSSDASILPAHAACSPFALASRPSAFDPVKMAGACVASMAISCR
ncbi:hypothetical protein G6F68_020606 [Rhizopus microsporus]|nr:hypothetical protein G6F68_020606 [Rhizopus microsporus]